MSDSIQVTVVCFAGLKEKLGAGRISLSLRAASTCAQFKEQLMTAYPEAQAYSSHLLVARNSSYLNETDLIKDQDELACFPPVSGG